MGMTDLQYKDHLRYLFAFLEQAKKAESKEKMQEQIENLQQMLKEGLEG